MDNVKNDLYYIQKIKQDIIFINTQMNGVDLLLKIHQTTKIS